MQSLRHQSFVLSIINNAFEESLKQVSLFTLCCSQRSNTPISRPFHRISFGVAMSKVLTRFVELCPFACGATRHVLMFVDLLCSVVGRHEFVMRFVFVDFSLVL
jgi:hypothetical protein